MSDHDHELPPVDLRLAAAAEEGCEESRLLISRRAMLGLSAGLFAWSFMPRHAEAAGTEPRLLVVLLRGGLDGLHVAVPTGDPNYQSLRGPLALDPATLLTLDRDFRLNPAMPKFKALYDAKEAALIHAIAPPLQIRSHFECQYNLESGYPGGTIRSASNGWLNRLLMELPVGNPVKVRGALEVGPTPLILAGEAPVMSWASGGWPRAAELDTRLTGLYARTDAGLHDLLSRGLAAHKLATQGASASFPPGTPSPLQSAFRGAGRLLAAETGPRIAVLNVDGWDTHITQTATLTSNLGNFDNALDDFRIAIGEHWRRTVVVCVTEFGRTAAGNNRSGTDHGVGTVAFLAGGSINGGQVFTDWPGLGQKDLNEGRDLRARSDLRALFKGVLADHLGVPQALLDTRIFPDSKLVRPMQNLLRPTSTSASMFRSASPSPSSPAPAAADLFGRRNDALARFRQQNGAG